MREIKIKKKNKTGETVNYHLNAMKIAHDCIQRHVKFKINILAGNWL